MNRFHFRKDLNFDKALLSETNSLNPYSVPANKSSKIWDEIAANLKNSSLKLPVTGRRCRERVTLLLKEFRSDENLSVKASGIEEEAMDEVKKLLTDIASLEDGRPVAVSEKASAKKNRMEAEKIREAAVLEIQVTPQIDLMEDESDCEDVNKQAETEEAGTTQKSLDGDGAEKRRGKRGGQTAGIIDYLQKKTKAEVEVRLEEIKVRSAEAENRKLELELQRQKQDAEIAERKRMTDLLVELVQQNKK